MMLSHRNLLFRGSGPFSVAFAVSFRFSFRPAIEKIPALPGRIAAWYHCSCMPGTLSGVLYGGGTGRPLGTLNDRDQVLGPFFMGPVNIGDEILAITPIF